MARRPPTPPRDARAESRVSPGDAVACLRGVLSSEPFLRSPKSRDFLAYVASEMLSGRADSLHERTIARYALGMGPEFDGRVDSVARVRATRVRRALEEYYRTRGSHDQVRVALPTGGYVPQFFYVDGPLTDEGSTPSDLTSVGVVQIDPLGQQEGPAALLTQALAAQLADFPDLTVVLTARRHAPDVRLLGRGLGVRFLILCTVFGSPPEARVLLQLADTTDGALLWTGNEELSGLGTQDLPIRTWAAGAAAPFGDYAGLILRNAQTDEASAASADAAARVAFYRHITQGHLDSLRDARTALETVVAAGTTAVDLRAMYAFVLGVWQLNGPEADLDADQVLTIETAHAVLLEEPGSALAHLALAFVAMRRADWESARAEANRAVASSPGHPSHLFSAGAVIASTGDWERGVELMQRSFGLNPFHPPYQHVNLAVERLLVGDLAAALSEASVVDDGAGALGPLCRALALEGLGYADQARLELAAALAIDPSIADGPGSVLRDAVLSEAQRRMLEDLMAPFLEDISPEHP